MEPHKNLIARLRLVYQRIASNRRLADPAAVVSALGAVQAQDYLGVLWSIGLRTTNATETAVEKAIADRKIVRTWPLRHTLHIVAAADVRWMLELSAPRAIAGSAGRFRKLELDNSVFAHSRKVFVRALEGNRQLSREAMMELLQAARISTAGQRGYHILWRLAQEGLICFAARSGKQHTFALLEEWLPPWSSMDREAALAELALRYFTSHGPATLKDFTWWTGLKVSDCKGALASIIPKLSRMTLDGVDYWMGSDFHAPRHSDRAVHLLPGFDEFLLGYQDRSAALEPRHAPKLIFGSVFRSTIVIDGRVVGTWRRVRNEDGAEITTNFFPSKETATKLLAGAAERYRRFLGQSVKSRYE